MWPLFISWATTKLRRFLERAVPLPSDFAQLISYSMPPLHNVGNFLETGQIFVETFTINFFFTSLFELKINQMCSCCVFVQSFDSSSCNQETYVILTYSLSVTVRSVTQSVARKMSIVVFQCMEDIWKERGWEQDICQQTKTTTTALTTFMTTTTTTLKTTTTTTFKTMAATKRLVVPQLRCLSQQQISSAAENYPKIWKNGLT